MPELTSVQHENPLTIPASLAVGAIARPRTQGRRRSSVPAPQKTEAPNPGANITQNYDTDAKQFANTVAFEKSMILPALVSIFNEAVSGGMFDKKIDKILDMGCGPFHLGRGLMTSGFAVDGFDPAPNMIVAAKDLAAKGSNPHNRTPILTSDMRALTIPYRAAMMNFVHQCCGTKGALKKLFNEAYKVIEDRGLLLVTGAHPDHLHIPHSACEYDVADSRAMRDGDTYTGRIYDQLGETMFTLKGDHFWRLGTLQKVAESCGFTLKNSGVITDTAGNILRPPSPEAPYFVMTFQRDDNALICAL